MTAPGAAPIGVRARVPPLILLGVGLALLAAFLAAAVAPDATVATPGWVYLLLLVPAAALVALGAGVAVDPRPLAARRALAGAALAWLLFLAATAMVAAGANGIDGTVGILAGLAAIDGGALLGLAATTREVAPEAAAASPIGRLGAVVVFAVAIVVASLACVLAIWAAVGLWRALTEGTLPARIPWGAFVVILIMPAVTFTIATLGTRRAAGATFSAQAAANRRNSLFLLVTLVGVVAATAELIAASITFDPVPALWGAGLAALVGLAAAAGADRFGARLILDSTGARQADPSREGILLDVVREISLAAGLPPPRVYVIEDGSQNAFATGRDPADAALVVTRGLLERMDREELQGVIAHEVGHVRNLDTRYALYVAILVGLVALVTDGFLRAVLEGWRQGAFFWSGGDDAKGALAAFVSGILVGLFLLAVAAILRVAAPLFSLMVQASTSREREFLADATSVELTRNPRGLERALAAIADDTDELEAANRGTQHLWFRNPVKAGSDRRAGIFATHPSLGARIDRLRALRGLDPLDGRTAAVVDRET